MTDTNRWRSLCVELTDKWGNGKDYWTVIHKIKGALCTEPADEETSQVWDIGSLTETLAPDEPEPELGEYPESCDLVAWARWSERQRILAILTAGGKGAKIVG